MKQTKTVSGPILPEDNMDPLGGDVTPPAAPTPTPPAPKPSSSTPPPYPIKLVPVPPAPAVEIDEADAPAGDAPKTDEAAKPADDVSPIPNLAKTDFDNIQQEFGASGKLSPESYGKLAKAGYSKTFVDQMISNQVAAMTYTEQKLYASVGSAKDWQETSPPRTASRSTPS
jgi:hypothetical protein